MPYPPPILARLHSHYEELIWLARRPFVNPRQARAWYSQVMGRTLASEIRLFSGMVSQEAINNPTGSLVLEHYDRLSFELSRLLERHIRENVNDGNEFIAAIERCERVHITTDDENHRVQGTRGDYVAAGIVLVEWVHIAPAIQVLLWRKLTGQVCNANAFPPGAEA